MTSQRRASSGNCGDGDGVAPLAYLAARASEEVLHREREEIIDEADKSIHAHREELKSQIEAAKAKLRDLDEQKWERVEKELTAYSRKSKLELMALAGGATKECLNCYEFYGRPDGQCSETNCESSKGCPYCHRHRGYVTHEQEQHLLWVSNAEYGLYSCNMCSKLICGCCIVHHVDKCICLWQDKCGFRPPNVGERVKGRGCVEGYCGKKVTIDERQSCSAKGCELVSCAVCIGLAGGECGTENVIGRGCAAPTCKPCLEQRSRECTVCRHVLTSSLSFSDF
mmetsp:Transcript_1783/g.4222  ORF Transcript_1783/g.4222 Transcript_1783/m.4222 type:complete len:283 (-) Transcript_1783:516-1364(-)